jgi:hypothetical protein
MTEKVPNLYQRVRGIMRSALTLRFFVLLLLLELCYEFSIGWPWVFIIIAIALIRSTVVSRSWYQDVSLLLISTLIAISVGELILRIDGSEQTYTEKNEPISDRILFTRYKREPNTKATWLNIYDANTEITPEAKKEYPSVVWMSNSEGLHDKEWPRVKTKRYRVAVLGDSFTEGIGSSHDSSYCQLLNSYFDTIEFMNCGVAGSDPAFELKLLELRLFKYSPDMVIMSINRSDIIDFITMGGMERFRPDGTTRFRDRKWWAPLYDDSYIVRAIAHRIFRLDWNLMSPDERTMANALAIRQITDVIRLTDRECRERHIRFVAHFHPDIHDVWDRHMPCEPIMIDAQKSGVSTFDMLAYFTGHGIDSARGSRYFWPYDGHNNNQGYAVMAQGLSTLFR